MGLLRESRRGIGQAGNSSLILFLNGICVHKDVLLHVGILP